MATLPFTHHQIKKFATNKKYQHMSDLELAIGIRINLCPAQLHLQEIILERVKWYRAEQATIKLITQP